MSTNGPTAPARSTGKGLAFLLLLALGACGEAQAGSAPPTRAPAEVPSARAIRVETATIAPTAGTLRIQLPGEVKGSRDAMLAAALGGFIEAVSAREGEDVRNGAVLLRVDAASHGARVAQARVEVASAERELERAERLRGSISDQQLDAAQARVDAARAALQTANVAASRAVIRAPFAGTIAALDVERGEVAAPGAPLVRLVQLDPILVSLSVPDRDVVALREGMTAYVRTSADATPREGRIRHIGRTADLQTRAFTVEVELPNPTRALLPGMIALVEITAEGAGEQLLLPSDFLVTRIDGNGVFVHEDGVARWRPVEVGGVLRDQVVVAGGLRSGEEIVVTGHRELADGDPLLVGRRGRCCVDARVDFGPPQRTAQTPSEPASDALAAAP
ncbi:MAG: efflux RND transporter periplasmic adaptor subunit [Myxococcales bacterium]|nr:efflux RND transporter periplasmic adaptor subunit [Myxococcales bacterium]